VIYGLSGILSSFISIFLIPLYTKVFQPADYGVISILSATSTFLSILLVLSLDNSAAVWFWDKPTYEERKTTFNTWIVFLSFSGAFLSLLLVLLSAPLSRLFFNSGQYQTLFILVGLNLLFVGFQKVVNIWCRMLRQPFMAMMYSLIILGITVGFNIFFILYLRIGIKGVFYSQLIAGIVGLASMFLFLRKWVFFGSFSPARLKEMILFSFPLVPASLLYWVMNMASIYFLNFFIKDKAEIGLYQVGASVANILSLCTWAFFQAWTPFALSVSKQQNATKIYSRVFEVYCLVGFTGAFLLFFFAKDILIIFTHKNYLGAWAVIGLLAVNVIVLGVPNIMVIANSLAKKNRPYALAMAVGSVSTVALFFILIPSFGKEGAAVAMIIGNLVMSVVMGRYSQKLYYIPYNFRQIIFYVIIFSLILILLLKLNLSFGEKLGLTATLFFLLALFIVRQVKSKKRNLFSSILGQRP
jgi:O-antigen/teichoic acid export membrane protein